MHLEAFRHRKRSPTCRALFYGPLGEFVVRLRTGLWCEVPWQMASQVVYKDYTKILLLFPPSPWAGSVTTFQVLPPGFLEKTGQVGWLSGGAEGYAPIRTPARSLPRPEVSPHLVQRLFTTLETAWSAPIPSACRYCARSPQLPVCM